MTFKIVSTRRRGRPELCIVPSQWEHKGQLRWPKYNADLLSKDSSVQPGQGWLTMPCALKRKNFRDYAEAENELTNMLNKTDTETDCEQSSFVQRTRTGLQSTAENPNFNSLAQDLIDPVANIEVAPSETPNNVIVEEDGVMYEVVSDVAMQQSADGHQTLDAINNIYAIQIQIMENQDKMMKRLAELSVQIEEMKCILPSKSTVIPLGQAKGIEVQPFMFKPINDISCLEILDLELSNKETFEKLKQQYSLVCSESLNNGNNCAYRLLDMMFTKEFLTKCSWTGGSRNSSEVKIGFKAFKNVIHFFFTMVNSWDITYTIQKNEQFFKSVLKNALKRKTMKNIRCSTSKSRKRKIESETNDENKNINLGVTESPKEKNKKIVDKNENSDGASKINDGGTAVSPDLTVTETLNENNNQKGGNPIEEDSDEESLC